ncbi:uncharacterized protein LOC125766536 isoform X2 [Anopheles funestus]|uniref:uncharacterized protein LOC125766536 isoform X2 n=1 Tax=Anopheles funestus TaxID=62324 RepID=UPI0020C5E0B8|nr:uncharacterized protein LOC125766536 isoform X2 [Anopheles funestus]
MDYWKLIVLIISAIYVKVTIGLQRFAEQPKYTEVNPGQDALLVCKVIDKRGVCSWQKDNKPVGIYPKKYEWASQYGIGQTAHVGGDCSLWVRAAQLEFDDGLWECQVTASDFTTQDALTSQPVRLVVRVPPQRPRLEHEGVHVPPGHNVTVDSGAVATVKCVSHYGNPPAQLKWFLGDQEISPIHPQTNSTEPDNPRTWSAASVVQIPANKERHGTVLKCLALHESYAARSVAVEARLDVKYAPTVRLLGAPQIDLEEGKDSLILRCVADANPPASIVWRRAGRSEIASLQESLQLRPVGRRDAGLYTCQAQNSVGTSDTMSVQLDVKYAPKILSAGPDRLTTAPLFSPAAFECVAEGNPTPTYKWVQRISTQGKPFLDRGRESRLVIDNVTYDYQGEYECRATNFINGQERTVTSDPIALQVVGAPQVLRTTSASGGVSGHSVSVRKGDSATLSLIVCADPRPRHVAWEWGSLRLEAGSGIGRYRVDDVTQDSREDCYLATLHIDDADLQDQRPYYLVVENERGTDRHAISLRVEGMFSVEPLELSYLLGIAGGCLAAFLILICLCIYAVRARKCCFRNRNNYKTSEKDSEKADLKSRSDSTSVPPLDSIYTTPTGFHHHHHHPHHAAHHPHQNGTPGSPEAMKSTTNVTDGTAQTGQLHAAGIDPQDADLVLSTLRHQRDLFSGPLGIPDVTTRVGSVIHAFETMARQRQTLGGGRESYRADKPYDTMGTGPGSSKYRSHRSNVKRIGDANRHKIILPSPKISPSSSAETGHFYHGQQLHHQASISHSHPSHYQLASTSSRQYQNDQHHHHHLPPSSFSYTDPNSIPPGVRRYTNVSGGGVGGGGVAPGEENIHINNNNFEPNLPHTVDDHNNHSQSLPGTVFPASLSVPGTNTIAAGTAIVQPNEMPHYQLNNENESSNFDSLNLDDDYRKSSFGKQSKLLYHQQQQQHYQRRNPPANINTLLLARAQQPSGTVGNRTAKGLWSLFGSGANNPSEPANHHNAPAAGYSSSRNNPNVFFNATSSPTDRTRVDPLLAAGSIAPLQLSTGPPASNSTGTMRYYNHDNNVNSANRQTIATHFDSREDTNGHSVEQRTVLREDGQDGRTNTARRNEADTSIVNEGDNEATDNHVSGDKFLRGTTVSQSFIKNVRIIGKKSSSYDVSGAASQGAQNNRSSGKKRNESTRSNGRQAGADGTGTSGSSNGFKHRGSLMMAAAAKHFTKRNRAPQPVAIASPVTAVPDTDELTGTLRPKPPEDATNNADDIAANEPGTVRGSNGVPPPVKARAPAVGTANRRLLFQPRTIDRAEI